MWGGRTYRAYRHTGRMTRDPNMRMSNGAEVMFGMVGVGLLVILGLSFLALVF